MLYLAILEELHHKWECLIQEVAIYFVLPAQIEVSQQGSEGGLCPRGAMMRAQGG